MAFSNEWDLKANHAVKFLENMVLTDFCKVNYSGFITKERLTLEKAKKEERTPLEVGMKWGYKWEYLWLFTEIWVPPELRGKRIVYKSGNGEGLVYVNDKVMGAIDKRHKYIELTDYALENEKFEIITEVYAGHKHPLLAPGAITDEVRENYRKNEQQKILTDGLGCLWNEEAYSLLMDIKTLYELKNCLPKNSLRLAGIEHALKKVLLIDFELPYNELMEEIKKAKEITSELLLCKNGTVAPVVYAIGHSHLDLEWLWTIEETRRKAARTLGNQLRLIKQYKKYKYLQTQPWLLNSLKNEFPDLYTEVKKAVADGKIIPEGGMWVESDLNLPSGESLIRQFMYGKKFISEEFGKDSEIAWLPDVFGCSAALPQIMKGCGIKYFFNAKITWVYNGGEIFPYSSFMWRGIDGSEILTHIVQGYAEEMSPEIITKKWNECRNKENAPMVLNPFGHGDGGGGATRRHMEYAIREENLQGMPKVEIVSPNEFFEKLSECDISDNYEGELYFPAHRGTYTSQSNIKKLNRMAEFTLKNTEICNVFFENENNIEFESLWKKVLFNQFHDIIPGSSIKEVYERAEKDLEEVISKSEEIANNAFSNVSKAEKNKISLFNTISGKRNFIFAIPHGYYTAYDNGKALPVQKCDGKFYTCTELEGFEVKNIEFANDVEPNTSKSGGHILENNLIRAEFNDNGELISIYDKFEEMEYLNGTGNKFRMFGDMPLFFDAWDIDSSFEECEINISGNVEISEAEKGNLFSFIKIKKNIANSKIEQIVVLFENSKQLDFHTTIDWHECHKLLKVYFETDIHSDGIISETQFGYLKRPVTKNTAYDRDRFEVCQHKWSAVMENNRGFAILNNCKYGISADGGNIGLTLLKAPASPDLEADRGKHEFVYSILLSQNIPEIVNKAYALNVQPLQTKGAVKENVFFNISENNIIIDSVKRAEDNSGDIIVRLYECTGGKTKCQVKCGFTIQKAYLTNMLENNIAEINTKNNFIELNFHGFEVITLRLKK